MKLSIAERFKISNLLPQKGNTVTLIIKQSIIKKVQPTAEEIEEYEIKDVMRRIPDGKDENGNPKFKEAPTGAIRWNKEKVKEVEIDLRKPELELLREKIDELDKKNELTSDYQTLIEKIHPELYKKSLKKAKIDNPKKNNGKNS
ncbi:MAG: hypothetical protein ACTSQG_02785 [Promethearchaeota archaeon]